MKDKLTYEEALTILFASYNYDGNYHDLILARQKLEEAIEKAKKYDLLAKEEEE